MAEQCTHLDTVAEVTPSGVGCEDCLRTGDRWVHLRLCMRAVMSAAATAPPAGTRPPMRATIRTTR